jgi:hypothetical protein
VPDQIHRRLTLFKHYVSDQRLVRAIGWLHIQKQNFVVDRPEAFNFDSHGSADFAIHRFLSRSLNLDICYCLKLAGDRATRWEAP